MSFNKLGLSPAILKAVTEKGYTEASPIQAKAIPQVLAGNDLLASAQTGTGKTAGFTLPLLEILSHNSQMNKRPIRALVLTPTRELAAQVYENVQEYSKYVDIRSTVVFGGVNAKPQIATLRKGVDVLVATPGRLLDLYSQGVFKLDQIEILVLDEADRMLDMGFLRDIKRILALMPSKRQNLLFSATFSKEIKKLAGDFLRNPVLVEATPENTTVEKIVQKVYRSDKGRKTALTIKLISDGDWKQVLIFTRTKHGANKLSEKLEKGGITSAAIHGNKSQNARTKALAGFKGGTVRVLVATDIAARGLDIPLLPHVINFELPNVPEDYVHRIGRTGRAGASGEALSLVDQEELPLLRGIERLIDQKLEVLVMEGFEPTKGGGKPDPDIRERGGRPDFRNKPKRNGGGNFNRNKPRPPRKRD